MAISQALMRIRDLSNSMCFPGHSCCESEASAGW
jgi:hypothetical protein